MPRTANAKTKTKPSAPATGHALGFHQGEILHRLANTYPTLLLTLVEAAQNAIDADAETVHIGIDTVNRLVVVHDDGAGVTVEKFQQALLSVGKGIKAPGSLGHFGLGLVSPVNKCEIFHFYSAPMGDVRVNHWTFNGEEIRTQHETVQIPFEHLKGLPKVPAQFVPHMPRTPRWRTVVKLERVTAQKVISLLDLSELEGHIRTKLSRGMRRVGTTVHVTLITEQGVETRTIKPATFTGERLPVVELHSEESGTVRFELYRAPKTSGHRHGEVVVVRDGDNYPISWHEFRAQAMGAKWLSTVKEAFAALSSGFFEGTIYIQADLDPGRTKFALSDALYASYLVIDRWFREHGETLYNEELNVRREQRYQRLGEQSLGRILEQLNTNPELARMAQGLVGILPSEAPLEDQAADQDTTQRERSSFRATAKPRSTVSPPAPAAGRRPKKQTRPRATSTGTIHISFVYEKMSLSLDLFSFDPSTGVMTFNVLHSTWVSVDETDGKHTAANDRQVRAIQEWLTFKVLLALSEHGIEELGEHTAAIMREAKSYVPLFIMER
jgi:hypothetical protein